ncbi:MAG: ROK family protein [Clostridia bacterium]|nr:ROK family protein [Clostridia bacterium]
MRLLTIDVGGTQIKHCIVENGNCTTDVKKIPTRCDNMEEYLSTLHGIYAEYGGEVEGIAMSVPGTLDNETGFMYTGGAMSFVSNVNFASLVSSACGGVRVAIENDAKAAGLAELESGALKDANNGLVVVLGTGIGGCTIVNRQIVRGANQFAGEFSVIISKPQAEGFFSLWGINDSAIGLLARYAQRIGIKPTDIDGIEFFNRAENGDKAALETLHEFCKSLCVQLLNIQCVIDPDVIAIGGGISAAPLLHKVLHEELNAYVEEYNKSFSRLKPRLVPCKYRNEANLIGAYYNFVNIFGKRS